MLKSIFKIHKSIVITILVLAFMFGSVIAVHIFQNPREIYHAKYLDDLNHNKENAFIVKHTIFTKIDCQYIENWAKDNVNFNEFDSSLTFISYSDALDNRQNFSRDDYDRAVWDDMICQMDNQSGKCYICRKWYE